MATNCIIPRAKRCNNCSRQFPATLDHFHKNKRTDDGLCHVCKGCARARAKQWYHDNAERSKASAAAWQKTNPEKAREHRKRTKQNRKEYIKAYQKKYRKKNAERINEYNREYRKEHPEVTKKYYRNNKDKVRAHVLNRIARKKKAKGNHTAKDVQKKYKNQKGLCWWCSKELNGVYHVDHLVPLSRGGSNGPRNIVLACEHCNLSRNNKMPHEWSDRLL